jgi:cytoskeleton protein RodZ
MSEAESASAGTSTEDAFGTKLAAAREAMSLSVNDIAARLRLSPRQVAAIEREDFGALPELVYLRGFVRNYAKEVRLDPAPLLAALDQRAGPAPQAALPEHGPSLLVRSAERERASRSMVIAGAVGALIVFAIVGWLSIRTSEPPAAPAAAVGEASSAPAAPAAAPAPAADGASESAASAPPAAPIDAVSAEPPAPGADAAASEPLGPGAIRFVVRGESWIEVTQQDGKVLLSENLPAGTEQIVRGRPPYRIVIGNSAAVELEYGGEMVDLKPVTRAGNVARLTLR